MGKHVAVVLAAVAGGCFSPTPAAGVPCGPGDTCPTGLTCYDGFCLSSPPTIDASGGDVIDSDNAAPGPVTNLVVTAPASGGLDVAWVNPGDADLAGVLIVRDPGSFAPVDGTTYVVGDAAGTGRVVFAATGSGASIPALASAQHQIAAWSFDTGGRFSVIATTSGRTDLLGAQIGQISVDLATTALTIVQQPDGLTLSGTASYSVGTKRVTLTLDVRNDTRRLLFNLKALTTASSQGSQTGPTFPLVGGVPSKYYGPESLDLATTATRTFSIDNVTTSPFTMTLSFVDAPMLYAGESTLGASDLSGSNEGGTVDAAAGGLRQGTITHDGKLVFCGSKRGGEVVVIDTRTRGVSTSADLGSATNGLRSVVGVAVAPDDSKLYVVINDGVHANGGDNSHTGFGNVDARIDVVELALPALTETRRVTLYAAAGNGRVGREISQISGTKAAVIVSSGDAVHDELWLVDLETMTAIDTDANASGIQPVALASRGYAEHVTWDGQRAIVGYNDHGLGNGDLTVPLDIVDTATFAVTSRAIAGGGTASGPLVASGGRVFYASRKLSTNGFVVVDLAAGSLALPGLVEANGAVLDPLRGRYFALSGSTAVVVDAATDTPIDTDGDANNGATPAPLQRAVKSHMIVISPF